MLPRPVLISVLLLVAIGTAFLLPQPRYESLDILSELDIPFQFPGWKSMDVSKELNLKDDRYNFIQNSFARLYRNEYGEDLLLLILDAGNFHNPKVCYTSSGFTVQELDDATFKTKGAEFKSNALNMEREKQGVFLFYWLCIDKQIKDWTGQKITELWSSLINRRKAGLMVRLEISSKGRTAKQAAALGQEFISTLNDHMRKEQREYLFGL